MKSAKTGLFCVSWKSIIGRSNFLLSLGQFCIHFEINSFLLSMALLYENILLHGSMKNLVIRMCGTFWYSHGDLHGISQLDLIKLNMEIMSVTDDFKCFIVIAKIVCRLICFQIFDSSFLFLTRLLRPILKLQTCNYCVIHLNCYQRITATWRSLWMRKFV